MKCTEHASMSRVKALGLERNLYIKEIEFDFGFIVVSTSRIKKVSNED